MKILGGGLTPLAKKKSVSAPSPLALATRSLRPLRSSRVQHDADGKLIDSDGESLPAEDDSDDKTNPKSTTTKSTSTPPPIPRPAGLDSPLPTPASLPGDSAIAPTKNEGRETRNIRHRVEALEWEDENGSATRSTTRTDTGEATQDTQDTDIADGAKEDEHPRDVELADVAAEVSESAQIIDETVDDDAEIADVAAEVAESAEVSVANDEKDMEVAEVAAEVAESAEIIQKADEKDVVFVDADAEAAKVESHHVAESATAAAPPIASVSPPLFQSTQ